MTAYFMDDKQSGFTHIEDAMEWIDRQAVRRLGMRGDQAVAKGWADFFRG